MLATSRLVETGMQGQLPGLGRGLVSALAKSALEESQEVERTSQSLEPGAGQEHNG